VLPPSHLLRFRTRIDKRKRAEQRDDRFQVENEKEQVNVPTPSKSAKPIATRDFPLQPPVALSEIHELEERRRLSCMVSPRLQCDEEQPTTTRHSPAIDSAKMISLLYMLAILRAMKCIDEPVKSKPSLLSSIQQNGCFLFVRLRTLENFGLQNTDVIAK
jgi:hypothetical protein